MISSGFPGKRDAGLGEGSAMGKGAQIHVSGCRAGTESSCHSTSQVLLAGAGWGLQLAVGSCAQRSDASLNPTGNVGYQAAASLLGGSLQQM